MDIINFIKNNNYKLLNIANYNDIDYYVIDFEDNYKFFYEENNEIKELFDSIILEKLNAMLKLITG
ncbi:MAG: hypothetical protein IKP07_06430 [Bacilli bacterium]|jgi:hypothetical protein|nr:hypothetical protein [Bacilli bacterium]